jgi:hypothetical protein
MRALIFIFILAFNVPCLAQRYGNQRSNEGKLMLLNLVFGGHTPGADLADRFGRNLSLGGGFDFVTAKSYILGVQSTFFFGDEVKQDVLAPLRNDDGFIFGDNGAPSEISLKERGLSIDAHIGKIIGIGGTSLRSGIRLTAGAGFFQHKIRIQDDPVAPVSILNKQYKKGYDRLSNGFVLTQFIGYQHLSNNRRINFLAGFEFSQAFTESRRSFNFDTRMKENEKRLDLLYGIRIGWTLPFYVGENADEIRY